MPKLINLATDILSGAPNICNCVLLNNLRAEYVANGNFFSFLKIKNHYFPRFIVPMMQSFSEIFRPPVLLVRL